MVPSAIQNSIFFLRRRFSWRFIITLKMRWLKRFFELLSRLDGGSQCWRIWFIYWIGKRDRKIWTFEKKKEKEKENWMEFRSRNSELSGVDTGHRTLTWTETRAKGKRGTEEARNGQSARETLVASIPDIPVLSCIVMYSRRYRRYTKEMEIG